MENSLHPQVTQGRNEEEGRERENLEASSIHERIGCGILYVCVKAAELYF